MSNFFPMDERTEARRVIARIKKANRFPANTDPCSRHVSLIGEQLCSKRPVYPMLSEEPAHCGLSMLYTVAMLWEARNELAALRAEQPTKEGE